MPNTDTRRHRLVGLLCLTVIPVAVSAAPVAVPQMAQSGAAKAPASHQSDEIVVTAKPRRPVQRYRATIEDVYNVIGFEGAKPNVGGRMAFTNRGIDFVTARATYGVPFESVRSFAIEHTNHGLMRGTKGMVASFAPQGIGQVYSLFRPGAAMLTLIYADADGGLHGAVLVIPEKRKTDVARALSVAGVREDVAEPDVDGVGMIPVRAGPSTRHALALHDIEVRMPTAAVGIPLAYRTAIYEAVLERMADRDHAFTIRRDGDRRSQRDAHRLTTTIVKFSKGNAGLRGAVPIVGALAGKTSIHATIKLLDSRGSAVFTDDVKGARLLPGESTGATIGLAKQISKRIAGAELLPAARVVSR